ncbi:MAG: alpha-glucan family phosphorylase [Candidatus Aenigmatarchaeota archaeon]
MMELGIDSSIPTYSGGMGVLGGCMAKAAADIGLPFAVVTNLYNRGYFRQEIDKEGNQVEHYDPWKPEEKMQKIPEHIYVKIEGRDVAVHAWRYDVKGRRGVVPVYFLDTNGNGNHPRDEEITSRLYRDDLRIKQEAVLGIGGARLLEKLGYDIGTYHMNESHSAFLVLELLKKMPLEKVKELCVFTTHSPVAGHEHHDYGTVRNVIGDLPVNIGDLAGRGWLDMTKFAMNSSRYVNGVSKKHGETCGIDYITNGAHAYTWVSKPFQELYDSEIPQWRDDPGELRNAHKIERSKILVAHQAAKDMAPDYTEEKLGIRFDPNRPIIGWARRMTCTADEYKRPWLLFSDMERLTNTLKKYDAQLIYGGKAHPSDWKAKLTIRYINGRLKELREKGINAGYGSNYGMNDCAMLTSFCDIWLNTPRVPCEASGTSGMCADLNGVPQHSTLDGWWYEAMANVGGAEGVIGWSIGGTTSDDRKDAEDLLRKLDITLPKTGSLEMAEVMAGAIARNASHFTSERMMKEYAEKAYGCM